MSSINKIKVGGIVYTIADGTEPLIAPVQNSLVASKAYAVGEQFIYNGNLYKATASIASGGTITINGNCALADSIADQVTELNNGLNDSLSHHDVLHTMSNQTSASQSETFSVLNIDKYKYLYLVCVNFSNSYRVASIVIPTSVLKTNEGYPFLARDYVSESEYHTSIMQLNSNGTITARAMGVNINTTRTLIYGIY